MTTNNMNQNQTSPEPDDLIDALALLRVSTDGQDVERQRYDIEELAEEHHLRIVETLKLEGISGTSMMTNEQAKKLLQRLSQPHIKGLAVSSVDRVIRPQRGSDFGIANYFQDFSKKLWTVADGVIDMGKDDGFDRFISASSRAGKELREIRRRSIGGKLKNARAGFLNSGSVPYGYRYVFTDRNTRTRATMALDPVEAAIVRRIFEMALQHMSCRAIARVLNLEGIPSKRAGMVVRKERDGQDGRTPCAAKINSGKWGRTTVQQILKQPAYCGTFAYHKRRPDQILIPCPAIIDQRMWEAVQQQLSCNKIMHSGPTGAKREYELTGLGLCLFCGHRIGTFPRRGLKAYYRCNNITQHPPSRRICTDGPCIDKDHLEKTIWSAVWQTVTNGDTLARMIATAYEITPLDPQRAAEVEQLRRRITELKDIEDRAHENMRDPRYPREFGMREWEQAAQNSREAKYALSEAEASIRPRTGVKPEDPAIQALAARLKAYEPEGFEERRAFLNLLVREFATDGKQIDIELNVPEDFFLPPMDTSSEGKGNTIVTRGQYSVSELCTPSVRPPLTTPISFTINALLR